jgi:thymidylate synthase
MNNLDKKYQALLQDILDNGVEKKDRTGTGTISVFGRQIRHKMSEGFPLLTTKKMAWKSMVTELLWFLRGDTNIKYLVDNGCHIWNGDCFSNYQKEFKRLHYHTAQMSKEEFINKIKTDDEFAKKWGELGPIYGKQWRSWGEWATIEEPKKILKSGIDQIQTLINDLKTNPDSRRLMVNAWNVGELDQMVLPPCHYGFQVYTRELSLEERMKYSPVKSMMHPDGTGLLFYDYDWDKAPTRAISLMWNQRSVDTFLGLPFNIASYGLLLEIIAKEVNMVPDELIGNLGDVHLYSNHIEQAKEQIGRELSLDERSFIAGSNHSEVSQNIKMFVGIDEDSTLHRHLDNLIIPTRTREPYPLPKLWINNLRSDSNSIINDVTKWSSEDFGLENYQSHPAIKAPLSN